MDKDELREILKPHLQYLKSTGKWDDYAKEQNLPLSSTIKFYFGSWTDVKNEFGLPIGYYKPKKYNLEQLVDIAKQHQDHFKRKLEWDSYSKEHELPSTATFIKVFGSWMKAKEQAGITDKKRKKDLYNKEMIEKVLKEHGNNFLNRQHWDQYAKENKLPSYNTIKKHFEYDEILSFAKNKKTLSLTRDDLIKIALEHKEDFLTSSMVSWDRYAKERNLPSSNKYHKVFGSWTNAKTEVTKRV